MKNLSDKESCRDKLDGKNVVCLGDSITEFSDSYVSMLSKKYNLGSIKNYGVSGSRIALVVGENDAFVKRFSFMSDTADIVTVFGGTNDFSVSVPIGDKNDTSAETFYGALNLLTDGLISKYPNAKIVFFTPVVRSGHLKNVNAGGFKLADYVNAIKMVCRKKNMPVLDLYALWDIDPDDPHQKSVFIDDGLHPTIQGHIELTEIISDFLENII